MGIIVKCINVFIIMRVFYHKSVTDSLKDVDLIRGNLARIGEIKGRIYTENWSSRRMLLDFVTHTYYYHKTYVSTQTVIIDAVSSLYIYVDIKIENRNIMEGAHYISKTQKDVHSCDTPLDLCYHPRKILTSFLDQKWETATDKKRSTIPAFDSGANDIRCIFMNMYSFIEYRKTEKSAKNNTYREKRTIDSESKLTDYENNKRRLRENTDIESKHANILEILIVVSGWYTDITTRYTDITKVRANKDRKRIRSERGYINNSRMYIDIQRYSNFERKQTDERWHIENSYSPNDNVIQGASNECWYIKRSYTDNSRRYKDVNIRHTTVERIDNALPVSNGYCRKFVERVQFWPFHTLLCYFPLINQNLYLPVATLRQIIKTLCIHSTSDKYYEQSSLIFRCYCTTFLCKYSIFWNTPQTTTRSHMKRSFITPHDHVFSAMLVFILLKKFLLPKKIRKYANRQRVIRKRRCQQNRRTVLPAYIFDWHLPKLQVLMVYPVHGMPDFSHYMQRLRTFKHKTEKIPLRPHVLATDGLYATGVPRETKCFSCGFTYSEWKTDDDPRQIHSASSPECPYLQKASHSDESDERLKQKTNNENYLQNQTSTPSNENNSMINNTIHGTLLYANESKLSDKNVSKDNIQIGISQIICHANQTKDETSATRPNLEYTNHSKRHCEDECVLDIQNLSQDQCPSSACDGSYHEERQISRNAEIRTHTMNPRSAEAEISYHAKPCYPSYAILTVRISSFQGWPGYLTQTPRELASSGFLYSGYADHVKCFFCGGGLRNWECGDDPWVEHARWFPRCRFLQERKGIDFIELVQETYSTEQSHAVAVVNCKSDQKHVAHTSVTDFNSSSTLDGRHYASDVASTTTDVTDFHDNQLIQTSDITSSVAKVNLSKPQRQSASAIHSNKMTLTLTSQMAGLSVDQLKKRTDLSAKQSDKENLSSASYSTDEAMSLLEENRQLRNASLCKICHDKAVSIAFLPCSHLVCCSECAPSMRKCPICSLRVQGTVRTLLD